MSSINHQVNGTIAILTDEYIHYPKLVIDTISAALNERGYGLLCIAGRELSQCDDRDGARPACNAIYALAHSRRIKGLISISGSIGHSVDADVLERFLTQFNIPKISLNASTTGVPSVLLDDLTGMRQLMCHLLNDDSRQRIAYIRGYDNDPYSLRRETVFREVMTEYNRAIDEALFIKGNYDKFETYAAVTELLQVSAPPDAIVAANDLMALSAARAISAEGFRIPNDIAVTGFDDTPDATKNAPALTTVRQPIESIAISCVELLLETIRGYSQDGYTQNKDTKQTPDVVIVDNELIVRGSTKSQSDDGAATINYSVEKIRGDLVLSLAGLIVPNGVSISDVTQAYWESLLTGNNKLFDYIEQHLDTSIKYEDIHWWSNLSHQLTYHTEIMLLQQSGEQYEQFVLTILAQIRERAWSVSLDHEFEMHRAEIVQNRMQLQMSSCTEFGEILHVLADWLETLGVERSFLIKFSKPALQPSERANLVHVFRQGMVEACTDETFLAVDLLPASLQRELTNGLLIMCPVHAGEKLFGFLLIDPSDQEHLDLESTANSIGNAMRNRYLIETLEQQKNSLESANSELYTLARYDALTGLPNRLNFQQELARQCRQAAKISRKFAVLFIDLDGFKHINDTLGHGAGDHLLQAVAARLEALFESAVSPSVFIARLGGDEFTLIIDQAERKGEITSVIDKILCELSNSFEIEKQTLAVTGSVGCAFFPDDGVNAETLVKHADTAMYHAKAQGKNCMAYFSTDMGVEERVFLRIDQEMRSAIYNNEFQLYYQPKIDLASGEVCGVEALMRWVVDTPEGTIFHSMPDEFIPIAESTGFISQLDLYALEQACRVARQWELKGQAISVAVNLSVQLLQKSDFIEQVSKILKMTQLTATLLELEITESGVMTQVEANVVKLGQLRDMGIRVSIDDFGTGYSSLSYLKKLPINSLKIDRSFIFDLDNTDDEGSVDVSIVRSVIALGKSLELNLIAEGVETESQMRLITEMGCEQAQGYYFAKPLQLQALEAWLDNGRCDTKVA